MYIQNTNKNTTTYSCSGGEFPETKRCVDMIIGSAMLLAVLPWFCYLALQSKFAAGVIFNRQSTIGKHGEAIQLLNFAMPSFGQSLPLLLNVLKGDLSLIGPKYLTGRLAKRVYCIAPQRFSVRPGLVSKFSIYSTLGFSTKREISCDLHYVQHHNVAGDLVLLSCWLLSCLATDMVQRSKAPYGRNF